MSTRTLKQVLLVAALSSAVVPGQQHSLAVLAGGFTSATAADVGSDVHLSTGGVTAELDYSYPLREFGVSSLYLEIPFVTAPQTSLRITSGQAAVTRRMFLVTPGLRWSVRARDRVQPFLLAGFGPGWVDRVRVGLERPMDVDVGKAVAAVAAFGGGVDLRVSRHISLRAVVRDFVIINNSAAAGKHHRPVLAGGFVFNF